MNSSDGKEGQNDEARIRHCKGMTVWMAEATSSVLSRLKGRVRDVVGPCLDLPLAAFAARFFAM